MALLLLFIIIIISGQAPDKAIAMKFCTGVDVYDVVTWAKFNL